MRRKAQVGGLPYGFIAVCIVPTLALLCVFVIWPTINALWMSFTDAANMGSSNAKFIGFENYRYMFVNDGVFLQSLGNTLKLMAVVPVTTIFLSLVFAFVLTQSKLKERGVYRVLFFLPSVISMTVVGIVWATIFDPRSGGVANTFIGLLGFSPVSWLGDEKVALWCIAFVLVWQAMGYYMVMLVAAIDGISQDIYEAASIDGANQPQKLFRITAPLLKDTIGITFVLSMSGTMNLSYILSNIMTNGGPGNSTRVLLQHMYRMAFGSSANFGYAMSIAVFSLAMAFVLSMISRKLSYQNENIGR